MGRASWLLMIGALFCFLMTLARMVPEPEGPATEPVIEVTRADFVCPKPRIGGPAIWCKRTRDVTRGLDDLDPELRRLSAVRRGVLE